MKKKIRETLINIGSGKDYTIKEYAEKILKLIIPNKKIIIKYDKSKPNGTQRKILDVTLAKRYGWKSKTKLEKATSKLNIAKHKTKMSKAKLDQTVFDIKQQSKGRN